MKFTKPNSEYGQYPDEPESWEIEPKSVAKDQFGKWVLCYTCNQQSCLRPILDSEDNVIKTRKPIGSELLTAAVFLISRELTREEEEFFLDLPIRI